MTILHKPPLSDEGHAGRNWFRFGQADEAELRHTEAWEHETFAEEQARWERSDPEYARICDKVRQAKDEKASRHADETKARWDARFAKQRQATNDAHRAQHASQAEQAARRQTSSSRILSLRRQLGLPRRTADRAEGGSRGALSYRQDERQPPIPTSVAGTAPATTNTTPPKPTR